MNEHELLTVDEVAAFFRFSRRTVISAIRAGRIPASKVAGVRGYRIRRVDLDELFRRGAVPAAEGSTA